MNVHVFNVYSNISIAHCLIDLITCTCLGTITLLRQGCWSMLSKGLFKARSTLQT